MHRITGCAPNNKPYLTKLGFIRAEVCLSASAVSELTSGNRNVVRSCSGTKAHYRQSSGHLGVRASFNESNAQRGMALGRQVENCRALRVRSGPNQV